MLSLLQEDRALGLQSELQKQGQILNPQAIEILHLSSYGYDLAFRDEKSSPKLRRWLIYRLLIPLCTMAKSTFGLTPSNVGEIPWLLYLGYISICQAFSWFPGAVSQQSVSTMDLVSWCGFRCASFYNALHAFTPTGHSYDVKPRGQTQKSSLSSSSRSSAWWSQGILISFNR